MESKAASHTADAIDAMLANDLGKKMTTFASHNSKFQ